MKWLATTANLHVISCGNPLAPVLKSEPLPRIFYLREPPLLHEALRFFERFWSQAVPLGIIFGSLEVILELRRMILEHLENTRQPWGDTLDSQATIE